MRFNPKLHSTLFWQNLSSTERFCSMAILLMTYELIFVNSSPSHKACFGEEPLVVLRPDGVTQSLFGCATHSTSTGCRRRNSTNVVYCLNCLCCGFQYVGLTTRKFKDRMREHAYHIKKRDNFNFLYNHFSNICKCADYSFSILDNLPDNTDKAVLQEK